MSTTDTQSPIWSQEEFIDSLAREMTSRRFPPVVFIDLFLTEDCNFRCPYCFVEGKRARHMSKEVAFASVEFLLRESREVDKVEILLFGGEPLLRLAHATENEASYPAGSRLPARN